MDSNLHTDSSQEISPREITTDDLPQNEPVNKLNQQFGRQVTLVPLDRNGSVGRDEKKDINYSYPLLVKRKTSISKADLVGQEECKQSDPQDETIICRICKSILVNPKECSQCRSPFCQQCVEEYLQNGGTKCPSGCGNLTVINAHPLLVKTLDQLQITCPNKQQGCQDKLSIKKLDEHILECPFSYVRCSNFGCQEEVIISEFSKHQQICKFKTLKCERCETVIKSNSSKEHDCVSSLKDRFEALEKTLVQMKDKIERSGRQIQDSSISSIVRRDIPLKQLNSIFFRPELGLQYIIKENVLDLPDNAKGIIVKFTLTDLNIRHQFFNLVLQQSGEASYVDLAHYFIVGHLPLPPFGLSTEVILPWRSNGLKELTLNLVLSGIPSHINPYQYASINLVGYVQ